MTRVEDFEELRAYLFSIAYRILGSVTEAEDAVQETWLRFESSPTRPTSTKAFLSAVVTRISIDVLRSARVHRSIALEADARHLLTDVWTSAGVLIGLVGADAHYLAVVLVPHERGDGADHQVAVAARAEGGAELGGLEAGQRLHGDRTAEVAGEEGNQPVRGGGVSAHRMVRPATVAACSTVSRAAPCTCGEQRRE